MSGKTKLGIKRQKKENRKQRGGVPRLGTATSSGLTVRFARGISGTNSILLDKKPHVAFVGRSNVGKSSTLNALLGASLARVSATPGKTQEINFYEVNGRAYIVDLPGYGFARMPGVQAEKIRKHIIWYLSGGEAHPRALVLVLDAKTGITDHDRELIAIADEEKHPLILLLNKIDKLNAREREKTLREIGEEFPHASFMPFSALNKEGVTDLRNILWKKLGL